MIGRNGFKMLFLSNLLLLGSAGVSLIVYLLRAYRLARDTPSSIDGCDTALVLGMRLDADRIAPRFRARLDRAVTLFRRGQLRRIMVLGGRTPGNTDTEARIGREYLIDSGIPADRVAAEDRSRHTLENLRNARDMLEAAGEPEELALITSRFHLARTQAMAQGLGLNHRLCAAETHWRLSSYHVIRLLIEAYYLQWYHVGRTWSRWTRDQASIERIT